MEDLVEEKCRAEPEPEPEPEPGPLSQVVALQEIMAKKLGLADKEESAWEVRARALRRDQAKTNPKPRPRTKYPLGFKP